MADEDFPRFYRLRLRGQREPVPRGQRDQPAGRAAFGRTLKTALAMKGGVSLAVWIGGAVAELDVLRRIRIVRDPRGLQAYLIGDPHVRIDDEVLERADVYAVALASRRFDSVEFDVLAGASAGGLNGVLFGVSQAAGANVDALLDTWTDFGALSALLQRTGRPVNSVLSGDFFWRGVRVAIERFYSATNLDHATGDITLDLSATIKDADYRASVTNREGRGHFHFVSADERNSRDWGRDIPSPLKYETQLGQASIARLAYAARTTSSFPGAFEPTLISSEPAASEYDLVTARVDMRFAFNAHREDRPFRVMDGGVLDNIPIDRAMRALRDRVPDKNATRLVLYLDPSPDRSALGTTPSTPGAPPETADAFVDPDTAAASPVKTDKLSRFLDTVIAGITMRGIRESGRQEVTEVQSYLRSLFLRRGRTEAYGFSLPPDSLPRAIVDRLADGYLSFRSAWDYSILSEVLIEPDIWQLASDLKTRADYPAIEPQEMQEVETLLATLYSADDPAADIRARVLRGSRAALDANAAAVDWLRRVEKQLLGNGNRPPRQKQEQLDDARRLLRTSARAARRQLDSRIRLMLERRRAGASVSEAFRAWVDAEEPLPLDDPIWTDLAEAVRILKPLTTQIRGEWYSPWLVFARSRFTDEYHLAPFAASSGIPDSTYTLRYDTIQGDEPTPLREEFGPLRTAQLVTVAEDWMSRPDAEFLDAAANAPLPRDLDDGAKLAGSTLGNFGAFLSADWRRNDWWWGRLDAAAGIVRVLDGVRVRPSRPGPDDKRLRETQTPKQLEDARARVQELVLLQLNRSPHRALPAEVIPDAPAVARAMTAGAQSIGDLRERYMVGILSRLVRVGLRATLGGRKVLGKILLALLLPPVLVVVPLIAAPMRALFALSSVAFAVHLIWSEKPTHPWVGTGVLLVVLVLWFLGFYRVREGFDRRALLLDRPDLAPVVMARSRAAAIRSVTLLSGSALAWFAAAIFVSVDGTMSERGWYYAVAAVLLSMAAARASKQLSGWPSRFRGNLLWALGAIAAGVALTVTGKLDVALWWAEPAVAGLCALVVAGVLVIGFRGIWMGSLAVVLTVAVVAAVVWAVNGAYFGNLAFTQAIAAGVLAWVAGAHTFWWLGELWPRTLTAQQRVSQSTDRPRYGPIAEADRVVPARGLGLIALRARARARSYLGRDSTNRSTKNTTTATMATSTRRKIR